MIDGEVRTEVGAYLRRAERVVPGLIEGFYVVGSAALDEYVSGRSDIDFVAVVTDDHPSRVIGRLRWLHAVAGGRAMMNARARRERSGVGTLNGVFVPQSEIRRPVTQIRPLASHTGFRFVTGAGFDVNPVTWKVLAERAVVFRGSDPSHLALDAEPEKLKQWNQDNLAGYWRWWGTQAASNTTGRLASQRLRYGAAWMVAWGVLGAPRLHYTIATGEVIGKRNAGRYALDTFDPRWHAVIRQGLAYWNKDAVVAAPDDVRTAGEFALHVIDSATGL